MSGSPGLGDFNNVSNVGLAAEATVAEALRHQPHQVDAGRWPGASTVIRALLALIGIVVVLSWILTAVNGGS